MSTKVFGVIIYLNDYLTPVSEDTDIGLYNVNSDLASDAASGQKDVVVDDASDFTAGEIVYIGDSGSSEVNIIDSIASNTITMVNNLASTYTTANSAAVNANSRFKWIQNAVTDVTKWSSTMLVAGGIKPYTREIDLRDGGNIAIPGSSEVVIKNTSQFHNTDIYVNGLRCEIVLFTDNVPAVQWVGRCGNPQWTSKEFSIPLKGMTRAACITSQINETDYPDADSDNQTKAFPVLFGTHSYAKALRISEKETLIENQDMISLENVFASERITVFPITSNSTDVNLLTFTMAIGYKKTIATSAVGSLQDVFVGKYIKVVSGNSANEFRKITAATLVFAVKSDGLSLYSVQFTVDQYFSTTLRGNETCSDASQTWVSVIDIDSSYQVDSSKCIGFLDGAGSTATTAIKAYSYYSKSKLDTDTNYVNTAKTKFVSVPNYSIVDESTDHNVCKIDAKGFASGPSELKYFDIKTPTNINIIGNRNYDGITNSLRWWRLDGTSTLDEYTRRSGGVFVRTGYSYNGITTLSNLQYAIDKDGSTRSRLRSVDQGYNSNVRYFVLGYSFDLPTIEDDYEFDGIYLLVSASAEMDIMDDNKDMNLYIRKRKWIGYASDILDSTVGVKVDNDDFSVFDMPDEYSGLSTANLYFFPTSNVSGTSLDTISGHKNLEITDVSTVAEYRALEDIGIFVAYHYRPGDNTATCTLDLYEVAIAFLKNISISDAVYVACKGRIFNDTWGGRKTSANLIESPVDALEHVCRLQQWADNSITPTLGWGRGYAGNALIQTTGDGSFDDTTDTNFTSTKSLTTAAQFVEIGDCYTDKLKRSLCRDFFLANWTNKSGYECVKKIKRTSTTIAAADKLTLASIVDRASIRVTDPDPSHIYAEPFVRYNKNMATGKWDSIIRFKNVSGSWASTNVEGMTGSGAQEYWNRCVDLWNRSHEINKPPSNLTDLAWANGEDAYAIARDYITSWIDWMYNPSISFKTTFAIAGQWEECKRFSITLPHQTNAVEIECLLTGISIDPNPPYIVKVDAIMFSETIPEDFYIKKTIDAYSNDNDWIKTLTAYGDTNDIIKVI